MKSIKKNIIHIIYFFFSKLIILELKFRKLFFLNENLLYTKSFGFGDYVVFCLHIKDKLNLNNKILCFSKTQKETAEFFFKKEFIISTLFLIPEFLNETYIGDNFLVKSNIFNPVNLKNPINKKVPISNLFYSNKIQLKYIINKIKTFPISEKIKNIFKKKTITIFIKHYTKSVITSSYGRRQTKNLNKVYKLIEVIIKKNFNILILGKDFDEFTNLAFEKYYNKHSDKIYFFKNLSDNYSIAEQAFIALNSRGYIGSQTGANSFFLIMNKKVFIFDGCKDKYNHLWKNNIYLYKRIKLNKDLKYHDLEFTKEYTRYQLMTVKENSFIEIKKKLTNFLKKL